MPHRCDLVFAVLIADQRGEPAVVYWAFNQIVGHPLVLLDVDVMPLAPPLFHGILLLAHEDYCGTRRQSEL
jgi:hypothetical protein